MTAALITEILKLRRSRLWWISLLAFTVATAVGGMFMFIGADPDRARNLGLLGAKAQLADIPADWPGYHALLAQSVAIGGMLIFGLLTIWTFGREHSDHTLKDLLALPTTRTAIAGAKFAVTTGWSLLLTLYVYALSLPIGALLHLPGWTTATAVDGLLHLLATGAMTAALTSALALAASAGRGYLAAVGAMFLLLLAAQIIAALGYGLAFPWSVPALYAGITGPDGPTVGIPSITAVTATAAACTAATIAVWNRADQTG
ncbi:ABC-2 type transport system permease protein [Allocatelliglobosispora scoriae]|uniref:ABC-2 type transport system permease protein n=1 Tax=Allocatelliglobosispora scoriae TaxID=643052 RepID=A0A841BL23_9ACTN|nr:ABC transporter permease [Allocatelliglobosispora scoriae]MBB5868068.1 ABC-2 type transport system permease protein [Allocatelliglobosispora scoriae]